MTDLALLAKPTRKPFTSLLARVQLYELALLGDAPLYDENPAGITCGALAAYHVDRLARRPETTDDRRVVESIIDRVCGVSL